MLATLTALLFALAIRAMVGLFGYSGEATPPLFGDFEAQRHWMEITINLPPTKWYVHGPENDLLYWGLDYPPLSAHLAWLLGHASRAFGHPALVALRTSRGHETPETRAFMRNTVLLCDALVYCTAAAAFAAAATPRTSTRARVALLLQLVMLPALVLTDHGHFQYNCVSLGLTLWAMTFALGGRPLLCCVAFSLALNFKQMCLYLAPAFFCYLLAGCLKAPTAAAKLLAVARLGICVIGTFALCWLPFLGSIDDVLAIARRVFPVERHLYEDKVANIWCTLSVLPVLKLKQTLPIPTLIRLALATTLVALLPPCAILLARPSRARFLLCACACGLAFFLCSYQVHEKHILLPLLPAALLAHRQPTLFAWLSTSASFSLYPLLKRDGLTIPYAVMQAASLAIALSPLCAAPAGQRVLELPRLAAFSMGISLIGMLALHVVEATIAPPTRYPDLHSVAFAAYSCAHFCLAYLACVGAMVAGVMRGDGRHTHTPMDGVAAAVADDTPAVSCVFEGLEAESGSTVKAKRL